MVNTDMIVFKANGVRSGAYDMYSRGNFAPFVDPVQNVVSIWYQKGDFIVVTATRDIDTTMSDDYAIPFNYPFEVGFGYN